MIAKKIIVNTAVAVALAVGLGATTSVMAKGAAKVKCFGVAKAGKNNCAGAKHSCQGTSKEDFNTRDFVYIDKSDCVEKLTTIYGTKNIAKNKKR